MVDFLSIVLLEVCIVANTVFASYDKTTVISVENKGSFVNLENYDVPISDRRFVHLGIFTCSPFYVSFQSLHGINDDATYILVIIMADQLVIFDCVTQSKDTCRTKKAKLVKQSIFRCNESFVLKCEWNQEEEIGISIAKAMDDKGRQLISKATVLPHNDTHAVFLEVAENTTVGTVLYNLSGWFQAEEKISITAAISNSDIFTIDNLNLTLVKTLDFENQTARSYYSWILQGDVLHLHLNVIMHLLDVCDCAPVVYLGRLPQIVEEFPVGTIIQNFLNVTDCDVNDTHFYKISKNSYVEMNSTTGEMRVRRRMDRDGYHGVRMLDVHVEVSDAVFATVFTFNITVIDLNDNRPTFDKSYYRIKTSLFDIDPYHPLTNFTITDLDKDQRPGFDMVIEGDDLDIFYLKNHSLYPKEDKLTESLKSHDRIYVIKVKATDRPIRGKALTGQALVHIVIETAPKINISTIQFRQLPPLEMPENTAVGQKLFKLKHKISELKRLKHIEYDMFSNSSECENGKLGIDYIGMDQYSGEVSVGEKLDADSGGCSKFQVFFNITDIHTGTSALFALINIQVTNTDDMVPRLNQTVTRVSLPCSSFNRETIPITTLVLTDVESGSNVTLVHDIRHHYTYTLSNSEDLWTLIVNTSPIRRIDMGVRDIVLMVAKNELQPTLTSTALVEVTQTCDLFTTSVSPTHTSPHKSGQSSFHTKEQSAKVSAASVAKAVICSTFPTNVKLLQKHVDRTVNKESLENRHSALHRKGPHLKTEVKSLHSSNTVKSPVGDEQKYARRKSGLKSCCECKDMTTLRRVWSKSTAKMTTTRVEDNTLAICFLVFLLLCNIVFIVVAYNKCHRNRYFSTQPQK